MLVLAMEFSRCGCRHRGRRRPHPPATAVRRQRGTKEQTTRQRCGAGPQRVQGGLPLQNGTEGPGLLRSPGRRKLQPTTAERGSRLE